MTWEIKLPYIIPSIQSDRFWLIVKGSTANEAVEPFLHYNIVYF